MPPVRTLTAVSLCLLLATTVAACAEEKSGTAPSAVPSGGAASPQEVATFAAFVIAYERRYCESARACCGSFGQTALSQASCTGEPPPKPSQSDEDRFDAKAAARCLQSLSARGCGIERRGPFVGCDAVLAIPADRLKAIGALCDQEDVCASPEGGYSFCVQGQCTGYITVARGEECTIVQHDKKQAERRCDFSSRCSQGICIAEGQEGEPCTGGCGITLTCKEGICRGPGRPGEACDEAGPRYCTSYAKCVDGFCQGVAQDGCTL